MNNQRGVTPFPHHVGCDECRRLKLCNFCGIPFERVRTGCTNARCINCHHLHCGPGGVNSPGHGSGLKPGQASEHHYQPGAGYAAHISGGVVDWLGREIDPVTE